MPIFNSLEQSTIQRNTTGGIHSMKAATFKNLTSLVLTLALVSIFTSCAHHRDVRPGSGGKNHVVVRAPSKESAERSAVAQANHYCEQTNQHAAFLEEKDTKYTGTMNEGVRDTLGKASKAAQVLGGAMNSGVSYKNGNRGFSAGNPQGSDTGRVLGAAGTAGSVMTGGNDYVADMYFKCE
jgi:hypothetical protein